MKYLQIHIQAESGDDIGKFLKDIAIPLGKVNYTLSYKDSIVEEMVRNFVAEHMSHDEYFEETKTKKNSP
ncbi:MAG: hypothetical protein ACW964_13670 [Candidatus Hodarchaeales archaeon]|jgi:hypothetical protein